MNNESDRIEDILESLFENVRDNKITKDSFVAGVKSLIDSKTTKRLQKILLHFNK